jgi:hypothetical protein
MRNRHGWILALACMLSVSDPAQLRAQDVAKSQEGPKTLKTQVEESMNWY